MIVLLLFEQNYLLSSAPSEVIIAVNLKFSENVNCDLRKDRGAQGVELSFKFYLPQNHECKHVFLLHTKLIVFQKRATGPFY